MEETIKTKSPCTYTLLKGVEGAVLKNLLSKVKGAENVKGDKVELNLGDIYSEEVITLFYYYYSFLSCLHLFQSRDIVAVFSIPPVSTPNPGTLGANILFYSYLLIPWLDNFPCVNITLSYFNVYTASISQKNLTVYLKRPLETPPNQPVSPRLSSLTSSPSSF